VRELLKAQFPQWAHLRLAPVEPPGTDHTIFRLGQALSVRLPAVEYATLQTAKEAKWLPFLAPQVPLVLPVPLAIGRPGQGYPWDWSIVPWIKGERATPDNIEPARAAEDLARFVRCLQACDAAAGPPAGPGTGKRGLPLHVWVEGVERYTASTRADPLVRQALSAWDDVLKAPEWAGPPTWFHGDLAGNLIARRGRLVGAIDSGYGVGDPACDLAPGWALFRGEARRVFFAEVGLDEPTRARALGWVLGPDLIGIGYSREVPHLVAHCRARIEVALAD
jgi:aminoglycoside phosphotransferase (APT) family kinase protein